MRPLAPDITLPLSSAPDQVLLSPMAKKEERCLLIPRRQTAAPPSRRWNQRAEDGAANTYRLPATRQPNTAVHEGRQQEDAEHQPENGPPAGEQGDDAREDHRASNRRGVDFVSRSYHVL